MAEFTIAGVDYRSAKLNARQQWNVVRRVAPVLATMGDVLKVAAPAMAVAGADPLDFIQAFQPLATALAGLSDETSDYVLNTCLGATQRRNADGMWKPVMQGNACMWDDIDMPAMLQIAWHVMRESLSSFLGALPGLSLGTPGAPPVN